MGRTHFDMDPDNLDPHVVRDLRASLAPTAYQRVRRDPFVKVVIAGIIVWVLVVLAIAYVALHFITKYW